MHKRRGTTVAAVDKALEVESGNQDEQKKVVASSARRQLSVTKMARRCWLPFITTVAIMALLLSPACPESVCPSSEKDGDGGGDGAAGDGEDGRVAADQKLQRSVVKGNKQQVQARHKRSFPPGQCKSVNDLFPAALPISPNKVLCNMTDLNNVNQTCFDEADKKFYGALTEEVMSTAIVWCNLAMPNTGTTSLDSYMALGGAMPPLVRSNGCERGCVSRVRMPLVPFPAASLGGKMGFQSESLRRCDPDLFRRFSALVRCPQSGGHMDYHSLEMISKTCLRLRKNNKGGMELRVNPGPDGKVDIRSAMHKFFAPGTIMRDPAKYHYKDYTVGNAPDWKDEGVCRAWDDAVQAGKDTHGFACRKNDCESLDKDSTTWCLDSDFNSYMRFAHHRWNIFTRMLAGTLAPRHDPVHYYKDVKEMHTSLFTREMAIAQNDQGAKAPDYKKAAERLEQMPYFSIFERMAESVELLCFTFCYDCSKLGFEYKPKKRAAVPDDVVHVVSEYNKLDIMLYKHADTLFSKRVEWMREAKADGVQCDLLLSGCGLKCGDEDEGVPVVAGGEVAA